MSLFWKVLQTGKVVRLWRRTVKTHCDTADIKEIQGALRHIWKGPMYDDSDKWFAEYIVYLEDYKE